jgi:hypothetical protein
MGSTRGRLPRGLCKSFTAVIRRLMGGWKSHNSAPESNPRELDVDGASTDKRRCAARPSGGPGAHEVGWEAVRLSRPNMRPWTAVRSAVRPMGWREIVVFSRKRAAGGTTSRSVRAEQLMLIKRASDPEALPRWAHGLPVGAIPRPDEVPPNRARGRMTFEARWRAVTMLRLDHVLGPIHLPAPCLHPTADFLIDVVGWLPSHSRFPYLPLTADS